MSCGDLRHSVIEGLPKTYEAYMEYLFSYTRIGVIGVHEDMYTSE